MAFVELCLFGVGSCFLVVCTQRSRSLRAHSDAQVAAGEDRKGWIVDCGKIL